MTLDRPRHGYADFGLSASRRVDQSGSPVPGDYAGLLQAASGPARPVPAWQIIITDQVVESAEADSPWIGGFLCSPVVPPDEINQIDRLILYHTWVVTFATSPVCAAKPDIVSPHEQLTELTHTFSLNATQLADIFDVSRQTIYNWRKGETIDRVYRPRLDSLHGFARHYRRLDPAPVGPAMTWVDAASGQSLLDLLLVCPHDHAAVHRYLEALPARIAAHFSEANAAIERNKHDGFAPVPEEWRRDTLRSIGAQTSAEATLAPDA